MSTPEEPTPAIAMLETGRRHIRRFTARWLQDNATDLYAQQNQTFEDGAPGVIAAWAVVARPLTDAERAEAAAQGLTTDPDNALTTNVESIRRQVRIETLNKYGYESTMWTLCKWIQAERLEAAADPVPEQVLHLGEGGHIVAGAITVIEINDLGDWFSCYLLDLYHHASIFRVGMTGAAKGRVQQETGLTVPANYFDLIAAMEAETTSDHHGALVQILTHLTVPLAELTGAADADPHEMFAAMLQELSDSATAAPFSAN